MFFIPLPPFKRAPISVASSIIEPSLFVKDLTRICFSLWTESKLKELVEKYPVVPSRTIKPSVPPPNSSESVSQMVYEKAKSFPLSKKTFLPAASAWAAE